MKIKFKCGCTIETNTFDMQCVDVVDTCEKHEKQLDSCKDLEIPIIIDPNIESCEW